jgi:hypothetical protein
MATLRTLPEAALLKPGQWAKSFALGMKLQRVSEPLLVDFAR